MAIAFKQILKKTVFWIVAAIFVVLVLAVMLSLGEHVKGQYKTGVTFRYLYAQNQLKLDWKKTYISMLDDLRVRNIRLPVYWDDIEKNKGEFDFSSVDFQVHQAEQRDAKIILAIGRRAPGWPECHIPDWASKETWDEQQKSLMFTLDKIINRYKGSSALQAWQVENEPFLTKFGLCPQYPVAKYLDQEIALVKAIDPKHPIITTDSGELSVWLFAASRGDIFGSTLYRNVYVDRYERYLKYYLPPIFFRAKKGLVHLFHPKKEILNIELQAEPWTHQSVVDTSFTEQEITFKSGDLLKNLNFAHDSGFSQVYLWGVEYWYWAAENKHPEFLQEAKEIFQTAGNN